MHGYPKFSFWISIALAKICFSRIVINCEKYFCISRPQVVGVIATRSEETRIDILNSDVFDPVAVVVVKAP